MKTVTQIRDQIVAMLGQISTAQGYENDFQSDHIYRFFSPSIADDSTDSLFPKTFVCIEGEQIERLMSGDVRYHLGFLIIHVVKAIATTDEPQAMAESALKDYERFFEQQESLSGYVQEANLVESKIDGGVLAPEGVIIMRVKTERTRFGNP